MELKFERVKAKHLKRLNEIVNDPDVARYLTVPTPCPMRSTVAWYRHNREMKNFWWAIRCDGQIVGSVNLLRRGREGHPKLGHVVSVGLAIDRPWWGRGIGRRTLAFARRMARAEGFRRFEIDVIADNRRAVRLYRRFGFVAEGRRRRYIRIGRRYHDDILLSMWLGG